MTDASERHRAWLVPLVAAAFGALFFTWVMSPRMLVPTEVSWAMQADWRVHWLGWQFFRHEPWHWPPGRIDRYFEPLGTAIGLTDSIPLAAFALKPFSPWLPATVQYLGPWLCLCFALQGLWAARLMRLWTPRALLQLLGASCFILLPTLAMRTLHPALCAHWLLLWALWLYFRVDRVPWVPFVQATLLALVAGLVHPYLAVMVLALLSALGVRLAVAARLSSAIAIVASAVCATLAGWWLSGFFTVTDSENLAAGGLGKYSMNLLAPITPTGSTGIMRASTSPGWSTMLPAIPLGAEGQAWEGFQYFGLGLLVLMIAAVVIRVRKTVRVTTLLWPLVAVIALLVLYALSPRVTLADTVVIDVSSPWLERVAVFRATGRFFWPAAYLMLTMALAVVVSRLRPRTATMLLCVAIVLQLVDLREAHAAHRRAARDPVMYSWQPSVRSPVWHQMLPHYEHIVAYPASYCGVSPLDVETMAYLASAHGLSLNAGLVARYDTVRSQQACRELAESLQRGEVDDTRLYIGWHGQIELLKGFAKQPVVCGVIETIGVCVTARSYERWRELVHLE